MHFPSSPTLGQIETVMGRQYQFNGEGWDPVEIDPMAVYTAADVLTKIKTVDGDGSGLDADKLDGQEGAYYSDLANATGILPIEHLPTLTKSDVGLANVDNTSDVNKPVSTAQQTALNLKLDKLNGVATDSLKVTSAGNATLTIEADTDNVNENDVATLLFSQDATLTLGAVGFDGTNAFYIQPKQAGSQTDSVYRKSQGGTNFQMWDAGNDGAASGLDADLIDGIDSPAIMVNRGTVTAASYGDAPYDAFTANGFYQVSGAPIADSRSLLTWNAGGSVGPVQIEFSYNGLMRWRNKTDQTTWTGWKTIGDVTFHQNASNLNAGTVADARLSTNVPLKGSTNTFTALQNISAGSSTFNGDFLDLNPNDYGTGKPRLFFKKDSIATRWTIGLWDGVNNNGTLDLAVQNLTVQNNTIWHAGNDGAASGLDADLLDGVQGSSYARSNHKYHTFVTGDYYFDLYSQDNYFRLFTEVAMSDTVRFQPVSAVEYWDGDSWEPWVGGDVIIQSFLDGREENVAAIDHTHRKFRFVVTKSTGWPATTILALQSNWSYITYPSMTVTLENQVAAVWTVKDTAVFASPNTGNEYGTHIKVVNGLHDGQTQTRITVDITDWVDNVPQGAYTVGLKRLMLLSNYTGSALQPWTWNYSKVVDFKALPTVNSATLKTSLALVKGDVGLSNVDNTSDANKPVSTAQATAIGLKLDATAYTATDVRTKLLTVDGAASGLDADLLDGQQGVEFARLVATTAAGSNGASDGANTWSKLASYDCVGQFQDSTFIYAMTNTNASSPQTAMFSVYCRSNATGAAPSFGVEFISAHGNTLADDSFKLITNNNNTGFELWVKKTVTYQNFAVYEVSRRMSGGCAVTYFTNSAWTATVPVGSILNASSSGLNFRANSVWHAGNFTPSTKLDTSGTAAQATKLATARTINGVAFDGTANITIDASNADTLDGEDGTYYLDLANASGTLNALLLTGTVQPSRLGSGTADSTKFLRGDSTWATPTASAAWGGITGTLSAQTDLNTALTGKADAATTWVHKGLIGSAVDLNTYTTIGIYHQNTNANAAAGTNYPAPFAGMLTVYAQASMVYQTYQIYNTGERYHRSWYSTAWSAWRKTVSSDAGTFTGSITTTGGSVDSFNNSVGVQSLKYRAGWNNSIARWNQVLESDASYGFYGYDTAGANPYRLLQLVTTVAGGANQMNVFGGATSWTATYPTWKLYSSSNAANQKRGNTYLDTNGDLVLNVTNDADDTSYGTFKLKRDGSSAASGTLTTPLLIAGDGNGTESVRVGNDSSLWDVNVAHTMAIKSVSDNTQGFLRFGNDTTPLGWNGAGGLSYNGTFNLGGATGSVNFGSTTTRQMVNLWGTIYGIGIQNNTMYYRTNAPATASTGGFAWFRAGVHDVNVYNPGTGGTKLAHLDGLGNFNTIGELQSTTANGFRIVNGNYGLMMRNDGADMYFLMTASGDQYGTWNSLRPFAFSMATGNVTMSHAVTIGGALVAPTISGTTRIFTGWDSGVTGSVSCSGWFRTTGNTGLYCSDYAGGVYMTDATYLRSYNNKAMVASDFVISSDRSLKAGIRSFEYKGRLRPVHYTYKADGRRDFGFIAQEVQELYPEAVSSGEGDQGLLKLSYPKLTAVLSHQVNHLEDEMDQLKSQLGKLQQRLEEQQMFDEYLSR